MISRAQKDSASKNWAGSLAKRLGHYTARHTFARKLSVVMQVMWKRREMFVPHPLATRA